jgi:hypothetical protein
MDPKIPGLNPIWIIDFKTLHDPKPDALSELLQGHCHTLEEQCDLAAKYSQDCADEAKKIQDEICHLNDVMNQFKDMLREFYDEPPSEEEAA